MSDKINSFVSDLNQLERQQLLFALIEKSVGPLAFRDSLVTMFPVQARWVAPGKSETISVAPMLDFQPRRLVILEPEWEKVTYETVTERLGWWAGWWAAPESRQIPHREVRRASRNVWSVECIHVGQQIQFPSRGDIRGDAFGPSDSMDFDGVVCRQGLSISMQVHHDLKDDALFSGVILGQLVPVKPFKPFKLQGAEDGP